MMPTRQTLLKWMLAAALGSLVGCGGSDDASTIESRLAAAEAKSRAEKEVATKASQAVIEKLKEAPIDPKAKQVWLCAADLRDSFMHVQAVRLGAAIDSIGGLRLRVLDAAGDGLKQAEQLASAEREHIPFVIVQPVLPSLVAPLLPALRQAGSLVIGVDEQFADDACDAVVFCDSYKLGKLAGEEVLAALKRKAEGEGRPNVTGRVVQLTFDDARSYASKRRCEGFADVIKAEPGVVLVHDAPAFGDREQASARINEALRTQKTFDVVVAHGDTMALGAHQALVAAKVREQVLVVGSEAVAGPTGGLEMLHTGILDATIWQPMVLEKAFALIAKRVTDPKYTPPARTERLPEIVTPGNLEDFAKALESGAKM